MNNFFLILGFSVLFSALSAQASETTSRYEKIKMMYQQAKAPSSEANLLALAAKLDQCAEFTSYHPNQSLLERLVIVSFTISGGGPEFPDQVIKGLGFMGADIDREKFFLNYKSHLTSSELTTEYEYEHFEPACNDSADGSSYCSGGSTTTIGEKSAFRVSKDYVIYKKLPFTYGYCWEKKY